MLNKSSMRGASPREGGRWSAPGSTSPSRHWFERVATSPWVPVLGKVVLAVLALLGLALIGAAAAARPPVVSEAAPTAPADAAAPVHPASDASSAPSDPPIAQPVDDGGGSRGILADGRVVLNLATEDDLTKLPGIGPARARAVLDLRGRLVRFRAIEDLLRVRGIGRKTLARIKPKVLLDRPP